VVTGSSQGLGRTLARALAAAGASVGLLARSADALKEVAREIEDGGGNALPLACDVTDLEALHTALAAVDDQLGGIDSVIANAGISPVVSRAQNLSLDLWRQVLEVNLTGVFLTSQAGHPYLTASGRGRFVINTSIMARRPRPGLSAYAASKAGLEGLMRALAVDWAPDGICVNAVAPGFFESPLAQGFVDNQRLNREIRDHTLFGRWGTSADLPGAFLFLASDAAAYVTGQTIVVDGGYQLV
jgi:NAD(P)-dependent dehydrogenase (short-subunit alcohol dehydrogenase family)